ncbi:acetaldehyde dehydrogenase (acetylating) [Anaerotruncus sp. AF02-27]|jgi:acetaldehyde dehydrogenase (acetylating)|uniref:acetaldehyde dehydrogenase (acetylating) n=1 Tax=Anaerotruncus TaxID=244127 RepID=UPI000E54FCB1|nr:MULTISPECIES: acetaldehyde dehydrogenase (acetylating) [Anaerotruncus]RGX55231.1 acetaldehyde dehydrogenase (acetylating) [Anaerotruncus sp. AF02-27]
MTLDKDLQSIQQVRCLVAAAKQAAGQLAQMTQEQLDVIIREIAADCAANAQRLAKLANEETGFGNWQDKVLKNLLGSTMTYDYIRDMRVVGILSENRERGLMEIGVPVGVVAALIPSTNPTSTVMYKCLIAIKAGNSIVISPHPSAKNCILETVRIVQEAARRAGAPEGTVGCIELTTAQATDALLKAKDVGLILATGGEAMVHAAYSSGNPAIGVGPGNGPAFIDKSADIPNAVRRIIESKTFDNGTICASEQSIVTERAAEEQVVSELRRQGGYFLSPEESKKLAGYILRANGTMNPQIVGKTAQVIADLAGIKIPSGTRVLISRQKEAGRQNPYTREKLCPILAFFVEENWEAACARCMEILHIEGAGHTMTIHAQDENLIREFALKKPVSRLLVNVAAALGGVGALTNLAPALTLGCGSVGKSASSDNISPKNLINIRRVAWGMKELSEIRGENPAPPLAKPSAGTPGKQRTGTDVPFTREEVELITKAVLARLGQQ